MSRLIHNHIGKIFNKLTVLEKDTSQKYRRPKWNCRCECGNIKSILGSSLLNGNSTSCGCIRKCKESWHITRNDVIRLYKGHAKKIQVMFELTVAECDKFFKMNCKYCGTIPFNLLNHYVSKDGKMIGKKLATKNPSDYKNADFIYNGIDRIDSAKGYFKQNCVPCCKICNVAKGTQSLEEFEIWITNLISNSIKYQRITI